MKNTNYKHKHLAQFSAFLVLLLMIFSMTACGDVSENSGDSSGAKEINDSYSTEENTDYYDVEAASESPSLITINNIPAYSGSPYVVINNNTPFFSESELTAQSYEKYSSLDALGRCGPAIAAVGRDLMPTEKRGSIGQIKPSGWHTVKYDGIDGSYLYNRCHLIAHQLTAENANERNLITGTRYMNTDGMIPFENMVADYVKETGRHVLYRVTPVFEGSNLVASGVLMEAESVEDKGESILFCVYCYNVQPGITIDYATGESKLSSSAAGSGSSDSQSDSSNKASTNQNSSDSSVATYVLNTNTEKFHKPECKSVSSIKPENKKTVSCTRHSLTDQGYSPCGSCRP